jgi:hypothetical protein
MKKNSNAGERLVLVSWGGMRLSPLGTSANIWPTVPALDDRWWVWSSRCNENWQGKPKYSEKTCLSTILSTTNPTWPDLGLNPGRRGGKPATNHLSYGTTLETLLKFNTSSIWGYAPIGSICVSLTTTKSPRRRREVCEYFDGGRGRPQWLWCASELCRPSDCRLLAKYCQLLRIEGVAWSAQRIPRSLVSVFLTGAATISSK